MPILLCASAVNEISSQDYFNSWISFVGWISTTVIAIAGVGIAWAGFIQPTRFKKVTREIELRLNQKIVELDQKTVEMNEVLHKAMFRSSDKYTYERFIYAIRYAHFLHLNNRSGLKEFLSDTLSSFDNIVDKEDFKTFSSLGGLKKQIHDLAQHDDLEIQKLADQIILKLYAVIN